jgi:SpoVK/Ycf46/Vps4 family AAA+-type ATPase
MSETNSITALVEKGKAGYAALYLLTYEEQRALRELKKVAADLSRKMFFWTEGKGLLEDGKPLKDVIPGTDTEFGVIDYLTSVEPTRNEREVPKPKVPFKSIVVLRNFHHHLRDPRIQAGLLDAIPDYKMSSRMVVVISPIIALPPELEKEFALIEMGLPSEETLNAVLDGLMNANTKMRAEDKPDPERRKQLIDAAKGLTTQEAENAFSLSMVRPKTQGKSGKDLWLPDIVLAEKCLALRKTEVLEYIPTDDSGLSNVGGLDNLKEYVSPLERAFTQEALDFGVKYPKGLLLLGIPGTGKSFVARAISSKLHKPLLKLDMGKIYNSLVGQSEANLRMAIQVAEAVAPCILWIDEVEKGLANSSSGGGDSGVSVRLIGHLLTWMSEKKTPVYVYATANNISMLPPELLRKGRFDEIFSVDLPTRTERREILAIHLRLLKREALIGTGADKINLDHFAGETTEGFTGAEIAGSLEQAMRVAFHNKHELNSAVLQEAFDSTQPLSKTMQDQIEAMRKWCKARTRPANKSEAAVALPSVPPGSPGGRLLA